MKAKAIIWRKSIYDNDYICSCGTRLCDKKGNVKDNVLADKNFQKLFCPGCRKVVAFLKIVEVPEEVIREEEVNRLGNFEDFKKRMMN